MDLAEKKFINGKQRLKELMGLDGKPFFGKGGRPYNNFGVWNGLLSGGSLIHPEFLIYVAA